MYWFYEGIYQKSVLLFISDITHSIEISLLIEADKYKDNLLASVTHDIKNPLKSNLLYLNKGLASENMNETKKFIEKSINISNLMYYLLSDIIDHSQIKNKTLKISS